MNIIIKTKNIVLTESLEKFINEKIGKLEKFAKTLSKSSFDVFVEIQKESQHHKKGDVFVAEVIIDLPGKKMMAKAHGEDLMKAIIESKDEMEREIKKHKTRIIEFPRRRIKKSKEKNQV